MITKQLKNKLHAIKSKPNYHAHILQQKQTNIKERQIEDELERIDKDFVNVLKRT